MLAVGLADKGDNNNGGVHPMKKQQELAMKISKISDPAPRMRSINKIKPKIIPI